MKLLPLKEIFASSKEQVDERLAESRSELVKANADAEKAKLKSEIITKQQKIQEAFLLKEVNWPNVMEKISEVILLEGLQKRYDEVLSQLFPSEKAEKPSKK